MAAPMVKGISVFVGSETGLLKGINVLKAEWTNLNENLDKSKEVVSLCWKDETETEVCMGLKNKNVISWNVRTRSFTETVSLGTEESKLRGVKILNGNYVSCVDTGLVRLWSNGGVNTEINAGKDVFAFDQNPIEKNIFATGGKENELKIWDVESSEKLKFTAKNVRNDWLDLRVPVWVTSAKFIPMSEKILTTTGHHQVRMYDMKAQRRPILDMSFDEYPITASSLCPRNENQIVVGNTIGKMAILDVRKGRLVQVFKGFAGAIRAIEHHSTLPVIVSCGLDRYLHVHSVEDKSHQKIYLKSRLTSLLLKKSWEEKKETDDDDEDVVVKTEVLSDEEVNEDEIWGNMEVVQTKTKKKEKRELDIKKKSKRKHTDEQSIVKTVKNKKRKKIING
ncbi:WD repeat-containing protein 74-like [Saccostrea echinata]|uniref:WD repeat-containing protein 74-like n=1 Tax=Saccostrea echinata TaxID=191078 RepID=UPI002A841797|nr:WD repeat-containing protein 74-like [Saccostrea echinata]